ncbi:MAG: hypothetical protein NC418_01795 [Muribaculaceae bacterium]|nr:hypothetical protein [Muribaculaceae bacterium]
MPKQYNPYHIECLKHDVEQKFGRTCKSPADFKLLVLHIQRLTGDIISDSTLRRVWGYSKTQSTSRLSTLTTLARTLGFIDWDAYVVNLIRDSRSESDFISKGAINCSDLLPGDVLVVRWNPDRLVELRCLGEGRYEVVSQQNSKLCPGDIFRTLFIKTGAPMVCSDLVREGALLGNYIAGSTSGVTELRFMPCGK